ncbi:MAG TPA: hypothetical protein VK530_04985 [Candidatus Acidoferrum sp.]|nr:hypothetical protein [Candidatus Acidoferrum sp.]
MLLIIVMIVIGAAKWAVYTALLWVMIRIQKMQYNWLGLLGSTALATGLGYIPVVGPYVAWIVLVLCLWKVTRADIAPDVLFTVTIAGALMFCVNLFVVGWLMGNLGMVSASLDDDEMDDANDGFELVDNADFDVDTDDWDDEESTNSVIKAAAPVAVAPRVLTNAPVRMLVAAQPSPVVARVSTPPQVVDRDIRDASSLPAKLSLKGLAVHSAQRTAMIGDGKDIHTVGVGDMFSVPSPKGTLLLRCQEITLKEVILAVDQGERVRLTFQ